MKKTFSSSVSTLIMKSIMLFVLSILAVSCKKDEAEVVVPEPEKITKEEAESNISGNNSKDWTLEALTLEDIVYNGQSYFNIIPEKEKSEAQNQAEAILLESVISFVHEKNTYTMKDKNNVVTETGTWEISEDVATLTLTPDDNQLPVRVFDIVSTTEKELKARANIPYSYDINGDNNLEEVTIKALLRLVP